VQYGWGLGTFVEIDCYNQTIGQTAATTFRNPSWKLYATITNPAKGPVPDIVTYSSSSVDVSSSSTVSALPTSTAARGGGTQGISTGAIAGIAVGGVVAIALCVGAIMAIRYCMRKPQQLPQQQQGMLQQGGMGYVQQPPQQQMGYEQQGGMGQQHGGVYVPQQDGTGKVAELEQPAVYTQQGQQGYNAPQQGYSTPQPLQDPPTGVYQLQ